jgi:hypothetical protein
MTWRPQLAIGLKSAIRVVFEVMWTWLYAPWGCALILFLGLLIRRIFEAWPRLSPQWLGSVSPRDVFGVAALNMAR